MGLPTYAYICIAFVVIFILACLGGIWSMNHKPAIPGPSKFQQEQYKLFLEKMRSQG